MSRIFDRMQLFKEAMDRHPHILKMKLMTGLWLGAGRGFDPIVHLEEEVPHLVSPLRAVLYRFPSIHTPIPTPDLIEMLARYVADNPEIVELDVDMGMGIKLNKGDVLYPAPVYLSFKQEPGKSPRMCVTVQMPPLIDLEEFKYSDGFEYWGESGPLAVGEKFTISIPIKMIWFKEHLYEVVAKLVDQATRALTTCEDPYMPSWSDNEYPNVYAELALRMPAYQNGATDLPQVLTEPVDLDGFQDVTLDNICDRFEEICSQACKPFNGKTRFVTLKRKMPENWCVRQVTFRHNTEPGKAPAISSVDGIACFPIHHWKPMLDTPVWAILTMNGSVWQAVPAELVESTKHFVRDGKLYSQRVLTPYGFNLVASVVGKEKELSKESPVKEVEFNLPVPVGVFREVCGTYYLLMARRTALMWQVPKVTVNPWTREETIGEEVLTEVALRDVTPVPAVSVPCKPGWVNLRRGELEFKVPTKDVLVRHVDTAQDWYDLFKTFFDEQFADLAKSSAVANELECPVLV